ncbi:TetR/AcrR family transcriptional regulator [Pseudomonas sp. TH31]|uniref:TetR/AcrR family transcriptional regulator n=1 Tax=Pseudomonas sp. TH31 TaxID=2796396 RepID=UPI0019130205|nr:TetR/AcrR family transcriptional regulator [Pseudomonas sp. TH31]MBK5417314.1 TetR/AcrR family transcriptional regulator [Pseudomonas sp. TH31]
MATMGRPRTFDRDMAITQAMHLFWEHGYESTSLSQLKAAMGNGISAPSFYAAFGSKEALFQEVVERYQSSHGRVTEALFDAHLPPREAIELTLRRSAKMQSETGHPPGCLVTLGVMHTCSAQPTAVSAPLAEARARNRAGIIACIERGIAQGELQADTDTCALAAMFDSFLLGLTALARDGIPHAVMDASVTQVMAVWDALSAANAAKKP